MNIGVTIIGAVPILYSITLSVVKPLVMLKVSPSVVIRTSARIVPGAAVDLNIIFSWFLAFVLSAVKVHPAGLPPSGSLIVMVLAVLSSEMLTFKARPSAE